MHRLALCLGLFAITAAPAFAQTEACSADTGAGADPAAPSAATANGALDLTAFGPPAPGQDAPQPEVAPTESDACTATESSPVTGTAIAGESLPPAATGVTIPRRAAAPVRSDVSASGTGARAVRGPGEGVAWYRSPYAALGGVLLVVGLLAMAFRRLMPGVRPIAPDALRVVGRASLGAKQSVVLIHVGQRVLLIGLTAESMRTLAEIADPQEVALLLGRVGSGAGRPPKEVFDRALAKEMEAYGETDDAQAAESAPAEASETHSQLQGLLSKLRALQTS